MTMQMASFSQRLGYESPSIGSFIAYKEIKR